MNDRELLAAFEAAAIPASSWTHRTHVQVAYLYLCAQPFENAVERLRSGIQALNRANGVRATPTAGYHETITVAWARLVAAAIAPDCTMTFDEFADRNPRLLTKERLRDHYSKDRLLSPEARTRFVPPDLAALPIRENAHAQSP